MQRPERKSSPVGGMLSFAPTPTLASWDHRPSVSSPLSSSPIRASSPVSPVGKNLFPQRLVQSSPIGLPPSKFASRPARPNPVMRKREEANEARRRSFLQRVRQKSDDKAWQRRDIEGQFLKSSWLANLGKLTHDAPPDSTEADIEEAMAFWEQHRHGPSLDRDEATTPTNLELDELEAMVTSYEQQQLASRRPPSPDMSDAEYDDIFAELISQEQFGLHEPPHSSDGMDMTEDAGR
ncbi:hypothetical protein DCS_05352 [Drechmeria coniospora]|uniref:Uncharacterized protein n=1 Tax=Drechmeria coniospora TaxID=98403 RepID=A0A151GMK3_DRECN|nr:hypothetical protein DCS_05352 [Drechmeria coniospora]KYK58339.1 hypothetical protein DCS_05352 [Drechmeria coniospora]ODA83711.1 hypothetical protein RJ55_02226 [Drechmeria coniospora]